MQKAPVFHLFNPDNDMALANGNENYIPPRSARKMAEDLALLPAWYAMPGEYVMTPHSEGVHYWSVTLSNGLSLPDIKIVTPREEIPSDAEIRPWGWNPSLIKSLAVRHTCAACLPDTEQMQTWRRLSSRQTAVEVLPHLIHTLGSVHRLTGESMACHTLEEVECCLERWPQCMLKAPWSSSGKGLRRAEGGLTASTQGWCLRTIAQQGFVVAEPLYNKVLDFALEFFVSDAGVIFFCSSGFFTDANGAYTGNLLTREDEVLQAVTSYIGHPTLMAVRDALADYLSRLAGETRYRGFIGVDMMVCRMPDGEYGLHPCVEINWRMSMGVVAHLVYERYVAEGCKGRFFIEYYPTPEALKSAHEKRMAESPIRLTADGKRVEKGYQPLTPIGKDTHYLAGIVIG